MFDNGLVLVGYYVNENYEGFTAVKNTGNSRYIPSDEIYPGYLNSMV